MGQTLRIASANLMNGGVDPAAFAGLLDAMRVDVVALQELSHDQADAISEVLPFGQLEPERNYQGMGVATRRPSKVNRIPATVRDMRQALLDPCEWPELPRPIEILNVHILAPHLIRKHISAVLRRRRQMRDLVRHLTSVPSESRVLVGDINSTPLWPAYRLITSHLTDAAVAVAKKRGRAPEPTWGPVGRGKWFRIDHGFVRGLHVEEFQVVELHVSDHSAIVMDLSF